MHLLLLHNGEVVWGQVSSVRVCVFGKSVNRELCVYSEQRTQMNVTKGSHHLPCAAKTVVLAVHEGAIDCAVTSAHAEIFAHLADRCIEW
jgi:hypothetical protein